MTEISNKTLALLILATLAVVVTATSVQLGGFTGLSTGQGTVNLSIEQNLEIRVTGGINFGSCSPNSSGRYLLDSAETDGGATINCDTNSTDFPASILVENIGNVAVAVNVTSECNIGDWLPVAGGADPNEFNVTPTTNNGTPTCGSMQDLSTGGVSRQLCSNVNSTESFDVHARIVIDPTTQQGGTCGTAPADQNELEFLGYQP